MDGFKSIIIAMISFILIILIGYFIGLLDREDYIQSHLGEYIFKEYRIPDTGGVCRSYCIINNKDMYEVQVNFKKLEVNN